MTVREHNFLRVRNVYILHFVHAGKKVVVVEQNKTMLRFHGILFYACHCFCNRRDTDDN